MKDTIIITGKYNISEYIKATKSKSGISFLVDLNGIGDIFHTDYETILSIIPKKVLRAYIKE